MRLESIKLAGFKSFVDPTTVHLPSNLGAIVGPNGCGKSNIIDAVRWVMGESSAKQLRGESITDVIFNGSSARKPVGQASIELLFDNADGSVGGEYAAYPQIGIKRQVNREGESTYFLNGARCRRRDITDIFLGTGLGPRSYSIIEQGMISRLIEAKPEELRVYLEEAAGISKYKERRRETELRMEHTRENLARLTDLRDEIERQLNTLERQAKAASRYQELKEEERLLKAQLQALRWQVLQAQIQALDTTIKEEEVVLESVTAELRAIDAQLETCRSEQLTANDHVNEIQTLYYKWGAEITRVEQSLQYHRERRTQLLADQTQAEKSWADAEQHLKEDTLRMADILAECEKLTPDIEIQQQKTRESREALQTIEAVVLQWQTTWDEFNQHVARATQSAQVEQTRIQQLENRLLTAHERSEKLAQEKEALPLETLQSDVFELTEQSTRAAQECQALTESLEKILQAISTQREHNKANDTAVVNAERHLQMLSGKFASLEALQQAALGQTKSVVVEWLKSHQLADAPRLAQTVQVESGWERALETVLGSYLEAVCVNGMTSVASALSTFEKGTLTLFNTDMPSVLHESPRAGTLASKVQSRYSLDTLLSGVYIAATLSEAITLVSTLAPHESVITQEGIWLGNQWVRVTRDVDEHAGVLQREQTLVALQKEIHTAQENVALAQATLKAGQDQLHTLEKEREGIQRTHTERAALHANFKAQLQVKQGRVEQNHGRHLQIESELRELETQTRALQEEIKQARAVWGKALQDLESHAEERSALLASRDQNQAALQQARQRSHQENEAEHGLNIRWQTAQTQTQALQQNSERFNKQLAILAERRKEIVEAIDAMTAPLNTLQEELHRFLEERAKVEKDLSIARAHLDTLSQQLHVHEKNRNEREQSLTRLRSELEHKRMEWQGLGVRRDTVNEQILELGFEIEPLIQALLPEATEAQWQEQLERTLARIQRLGPINLAAIDEYRIQAERKSYLDAQNNDLVQALTTLEDAIRKIDRETRERFKETYDKLNENFQVLFPRIFGGGTAHLELVGEDLLNTGVNVIARPPGKRNSTIHLLSGGEKALTATALVFAIFQLNPAPFCMLDEVDAPLDDLNVSRFCDLVKELSQTVQFIFISHNKLTIEMANHLVGVTMNEPGVSRLVSVDVEEAIAMAEA